MTILQGVILGLLQGLTEFLPVSSSGHLALMRAIFDNPALNESPLVFDVAVHAATLLAIVVYFRVEVLRLLRGLLVAVLSVSERFRPKPYSPPAADRRLFFYVLIASVPTAAIGLLLKRYVGGSILFMTRKYRDPGRDFHRMNPIDAALVGIVQGFAVLPGISRSGSTIGCSIIFGLERKLAARFSFLIAVPAIAGAAVLKLPELFSKSADAFLVPTLIGAAVAFLSGLAALAVLMRVLMHRKLVWFAPYCWVLGILAILLGF
ncbi:MAG: hypothetical protein AMS16_07440 [Planctomycetes bacterium DG_58]|nr:MAG: hypothetical protein AMS16_07440 [Planctomycetes bacterium DG_58]